MYTLGETLTLHGKTNSIYISNLAYIYLRESKKKRATLQNHLVAYNISRFCIESYYDGFIEVMVAN
jgi:hypothetical protein